ncbi:transporter [Methanospirillum lacunae]|uniref:Transporter n=2 Tax=Methanospirillum lacunae TaxID=668570 RepID=A0A2V2MXF0_9EURY|nr:transporter [Methanospirillum lacunae]
MFSKIHDGDRMKIGIDEKILRYITIFAVIALAVITTIGCTSAASTSSDTRTITDMAGTTSTIPVDVNRIGVSYPAMNQVIFMLGGADKIVATSSTVDTLPWLIKLYPQIKSIPQSLNTEVNMEELVKDNPDVVIMALSANTTTSKKIRDLGMPVVELNVSTPEQLKQAVSIVGDILGPDAKLKAKEFSDYYDSNIKLVSSKTADLPKDQKPKVLYTANNPLNTEGIGSIVTNWIELGGGVNVAAENGISGTFKDISMEDVVKWNPDIIVVRDAAQKPKIMEDPQWKEINAVKNGKVYVSPKDVYAWCVRSACASLMPVWSAKTFHPELFADVDMNQVVRDYCKKFYGYDPSDSEINDILNPTV